MAEVTDKQYQALLKEVKSNPGQSERHYSEKSGITQSKLLSFLIKAELEADPKLKIPATSAAITKARNSGLRWPRIAGYANISQAKAKELFEEANGAGSATTSYAGRGRNFANTGDVPQKLKAKSTSGRRSSGGSKDSAATGTSGRRGASAKKQASAPATRKPGRRGTRAAASSPK